jgi:hypothetical protein
MYQVEIVVRRRPGEVNVDTLSCLFEDVTWLKE